MCVFQWKRNWVEKLIFLTWKNLLHFSDENQKNTNILGFIEIHGNPMKFIGKSCFFLSTWLRSWIYKDFHCSDENIIFCGVIRGGVFFPLKKELSWKSHFLDMKKFSTFLWGKYENPWYFDIFWNLLKFIENHRKNMFFLIFHFTLFTFHFSLFTFH